MKLLFAVVLAAGTLMLSACSSPPAPVIERSTNPRSSVTENNGQYTIRSGDTLHGIAFRYGLDHRQLASWNGIRSPYVIYPDQVLRLTRPPAVVSKPKSSARTTTKPAPAARSSTSKVSPAKTAPPGSSAKPPAKSTADTSPPAASKAATAKVSGNPASWIWPVNGRILRGFLSNDPARNGLDIAGKDGQEIKASAAGTVVYSGNGLIGYGELIIIKHSEVMLSAYAHNRVRLVSEGTSVKQGQKIAELGRNDKNEPILHFEIRVSGRPVDPRKYLPKK